MIRVLLLALMISGCVTTGDERGFWDQSVTLTAYGITMATPYGPVNLGYMHWTRNPNAE